MREVKERFKEESGIGSETAAQAWQDLATTFALSAQQLAQLHRYLDLLLYYNKQVNLTAIETPRGAIKYHFTDSLMLSKWYDVGASKGLVDVGTGAGFPALPLKIMYPQVPMVLIEPNGKKRAFLEGVVSELGLQDVQVCPYDWRTFIRTTEGELDLFVSRAALPVAELCRMFKPACSYNQALLVYWASETWQPDKEEQPYVSKEIEYRVGTRKRKLVLLKK